jgi:AcrR family transcriptional regulator
LSTALPPPPAADEVPAAPGLRARRRRAVREALAEAAMRLFVERGFDAVAVEEIAAAAGVSRRTFFRYFSSKDAVFFAPQERRLGRLEALLAAAEIDSPAAALAAIRSAAREVATLYSRERATVLAEHTVLREASSLYARDVELDARWEQALRRPLLAAGLDDVEAVVVSGAVLGVMRAVLRAWLATAAQADLMVLAERALLALEPLLQAAERRDDRRRSAGGGA